MIDSEDIALVDFLKKKAHENNGQYTLYFRQTRTPCAYLKKRMSKNWTCKWLTQPLDIMGGGMVRSCDRWGGRYFSWGYSPKLDIEAVVEADPDVTGTTGWLVIKQSLLGTRRWMALRGTSAKAFLAEDVYRGFQDNKDDWLEGGRALVIRNLVNFLRSRFATCTHPYRVAVDLEHNRSHKSSLLHTVGIIFQNQYDERVRFFDPNLGEWKFQQIDGFLNWLSSYLDSGTYLQEYGKRGDGELQDWSVRTYGKYNRRARRYE